MIYMDRHEEIIRRKYLPPLKVPQDKDEQIRQINNNENIPQSLKQAMETYEREFIYRAYERNNFNKTNTAKDLGISLRNLYYKFTKYNFCITSHAKPFIN